MASAADLVPAVEAYLEANGLQKTLAAMKAEAKAKNLTPSKKVRPLLTRKHTHAHFHRTLRVGGGFFFSFKAKSLCTFFSHLLSKKTKKWMALIASAIARWCFHALTPDASPTPPSHRVRIWTRTWLGWRTSSSRAGETPRTTPAPPEEEKET